MGTFFLIQALYRTSHDQLPNREQILACSGGGGEKLMQVRAACTMHEQSPLPLSWPPTDSGWWDCPSKRGIFAVSKKKIERGYMMLFSLDYWWLMTGYWWVKCRCIELVLLKLHDPGGEWTNPTGGWKGRDASFSSSYPFQATLFLSTFFFERRVSDRSICGNAKEAPMATRSLPGYGEHGRRGGRKVVQYSLQNNNLTGDEFFYFFVEAILSDDERKPRTNEVRAMRHHKQISDKTYYTNYFSAACTSPWFPRPTSHHLILTPHTSPHLTTPLPTT